MATRAIAKENGGGIVPIPENGPQIYGLIGQAMREIGAIGKDSVNKQQGFKYRGIDAVYNALNPVMAKLGLFFVPDILEQTREERETKNGTNLIYSVLKVKFTLYAPDGSNVSAVVIGEGMDSGDKASNKAMSVAMKYAAFQMFMIPTEEMVDPDAETHEVKAKTPQKPAQPPQNPATINKVPTVPPVEQKKPEPPKPSNPVLNYLAKERAALMEARKVNQAENVVIWQKQIAALTAAQMIPNKPLSAFTQDEAEQLVAFMYTRFDPTGTELKPDDGETA